jgi:thiol-disulfide isomerase/thioredoxin
MRSWGRRASSALVFVVFAACGGSRAEGPAVGTSAGRVPIRFSFDSLDARAVSSDATRGKPTLVTFVTTWNLACQAQVGYLVAMAKNDADRTNYVLVGLHERGERELLEQYRDVMHVEFPVAMGDAASVAAFGDVTAVPTLVLLDRSGREVWRKVGLAKSDEIRDAMRFLTSESAP